MSARSALLLGTIALTLIGCTRRPAAPGARAVAARDSATTGGAGATLPPIFARVAGTWDWPGRPGSCRDEPHTLSFTPDGRFMLLTFAKPVDSTGTREVRYAVRGHTERSVRGAIVDETRRTDAGQLVVWDLVLVTPTSYRWHRTDWEEGAFTPEVVRCTTAL